MLLEIVNPIILRNINDQREQLLTKRNSLNESAPECSPQLGKIDERIKQLNKSAKFVRRTLRSASR